MKVYIRIRHTGEFFNQNCFDVYTGCATLGIPVVPYKAVYSIEDNAPEDPIVGTLDDVEVAMDRMGIHLTPMDYPEELKEFLGRRIWKSTLFSITSHADSWHVFVKPIWDVKRFSGTVLDKSEDLIKLGGGLEDIPVWCSEKVNFLSEWRLWVLRGEIIGLNPYAGRWDLFPDVERMKQAVRFSQRALRVRAGFWRDGRRTDAAGGGQRRVCAPQLRAGPGEIRPSADGALAGTHKPCAGGEGMISVRAGIDKLTTLKSGLSVFFIGIRKRGPQASGR